ncbi:ROK family protein [Actinokineospora enzanensis]|uniref:ROK family protein n=1 Tax=Actinokineospora enzanensis TaxID=155975 RepID=UPI0003AA44BC|nr:ROK family protein [Actinokineospora enzanensis]
MTTENLLAIDIGATKFALRAAGPHGTWTTRSTWPGPDWPADRKLLCDAVARARAELAAPIDRVGLATAAPLDPNGVVATWDARPTWQCVPLLDTLREATDTATITTLDDGSAAALAEAHNAGCADLVHLSLGSGLTGGIIRGGRPVPGTDLAHLTVDPAGTPCPCGRTGCLRTVASGRAMAIRATEVRGHPTTTAQLAAAAAANAPWANTVLDEAAIALATALTELATPTHPTRAHIGGGLGTALPTLATRTALALATRSEGLVHTVVAQARFGTDAALVGALLAARS